MLYYILTIKVKYPQYILYIYIHIYIYIYIYYIYIYIYIWLTESLETPNKLLFTPWKGILYIIEILKSDIN